MKILRFKNESGGNAISICEIDIDLTDEQIRDIVISNIGDDYDSVNDYICGDYHIEELNLDKASDILFSNNYNFFIRRYGLNHMCCPKCGYVYFKTTLAGYIYNSNDPDSYEDRNKCTCSKCGDIHIYHDRVSRKKFENI